MKQFGVLAGLVLCLGALAHPVKADVVQPEPSKKQFVITNLSKFPKVLFLAEHNIDEGSRLFVVQEGLNEREFARNRQEVITTVYAIPTATADGRKILAAAKAKDVKAFQAKNKEVAELVKKTLKVKLSAYTVTNKDGNGTAFPDGRSEISPLKKGRFAFKQISPQVVQVAPVAPFMPALLLGIPVCSALATALVLRNRRRTAEK